MKRFIDALLKLIEICKTLLTYDHKYKQYES